MTQNAGGEKLACVAVVKNEARHIAEWVAYQFVLGFDTVILLDNSSTDATKANAQHAAKHRDLRIYNWPETAPDYQTNAYDIAVRKFSPEFSWMAFFDADEFLVLDDGRSLHECLAAQTDAACIAVSWAIFGSSGHRVEPEGLVIENFLTRGDASFGPNRHVKSIIRPRAAIAADTPHSFRLEGDYTDLAGRPVTWLRPGVLDHAPDFQGGKLHHYFTKSSAHWREKLRRGYHDMTRRPSDFEEYDRNEIFDDSAARLAAGVREILHGK